MNLSHRQSLGHTGEYFAALYLEQRGYSIIERNIRTPYGEIDIVARQDELIIFLEVKTRSSKTLGPPEISITRRKKQHMQDSAEFYMQKHPESPMNWRIDVISIQMQQGELPPLIDHFENAIS